LLFNASLTEEDSCAKSFLHFARGYKLYTFVKSSH